MEEEELNVFIHPVQTLISSSLILDLKVNYPLKKLVFYGVIDKNTP